MMTTPPLFMASQDCAAEIIPACLGAQRFTIPNQGH